MKLARAIAARTQPRFIEIKPEPWPKARLNATFIEIQRERGGGRVPFTEDQLAAMRGGLTAGAISPQDAPQVDEALDPSSGASKYDFA